MWVWVRGFSATKRLIPAACATLSWNQLTGPESKSEKRASFALAGIS
jgi:hypothetical protein